jgi:hypothetical protein
MHLRVALAFTCTAVTGLAIIAMPAVGAARAPAADVQECTASSGLTQDDV